MARRSCPSVFEVADVNKISKRKRKGGKKEEKIEPLFNKYGKPDEWRLSKIKRSARFVCLFFFFKALMQLDAHSLFYRIKHSACTFVNENVTTMKIYY